MCRQALPVRREIETPVLDFRLRDRGAGRSNRRTDHVTLFVGGGSRGRRSAGVAHAVRVTVPFIGALLSSPVLKKKEYYLFI